MYTDSCYEKYSTFVFTLKPTLAYANNWTIDIVLDTNITLPSSTKEIYECYIFDGHNNVPATKCVSGAASTITITIPPHITWSTSTTYTITVKVLMESATLNENGLKNMTIA